MAKRPDLKPIVWMGNSLKQIRDMPKAARQGLGWQLDNVQQGLMPTDYKPFKQVGMGTFEIRTQTPDKVQYRMFVVPSLASDQIGVLHCFAKKTEQTPKQDVDIGVRNYKAYFDQCRAASQEKAKQRSSGNDYEP